MRISDGSSYFDCAQKVVDELKVGRNEVNGINRIRLAVLIILASLYDNEMCDEKRVKSKCGKKIEEGLKHRVANPKFEGGGKRRGGSKAFELMSTTNLTEGLGGDPGLRSQT